MNGLSATNGWMWCASKVMYFSAPVQPMTTTRPYLLSRRPGGTMVETVALPWIVDQFRLMVMWCHLLDDCRSSTQRRAECAPTWTVIPFTDNAHRASGWLPGDGRIDGHHNGRGVVAGHPHPIGRDP